MKKIDIKIIFVLYFYNNNINATNDNYIYRITVKIVKAQEKQGKIPKETKIIIEKIRKKMEEIKPNLKDEDITKNIRL